MTQYNEWEPGATNRSIEGRLAEAQQRRREAMEAEQARLEAENRHKQEIAQLDAEIKALERQQAGQRWEEGKAKSNAILQRNVADSEAFRVAVDEVILFAQKKLGPFIQATDNSFREQTTVRTQAVGERQKLLEADIYAQHSSDEVKHMSVEFQRDISAVAKEAPNAYPAWIWLNKWVVSSPNDDLEKWRYGIFVALFGFTPADVTRDYDWQKEIDSALNDPGGLRKPLIASTANKLNRTLIMG